MAKLEIVLSRDEVQKQIPYAMICETRYGAVWETMRRKRLWKESFTESEKEIAYKLFRQAHSWYLGKGIPDEVRMSLNTRCMWDRLAAFCCSL